jgi:hypothetical protein
MPSGKGLGMLPRKSEFNLSRYICTLSTVKKRQWKLFKNKTYVFAEDNSQVYGVYTNMHIHTIPAPINVTNIYVSP